MPTFDDDKEMTIARLKANRIMALFSLHRLLNLFLFVSLTSLIVVVCCSLLCAGGDGQYTECALSAVTLVLLTGVAYVLYDLFLVKFAGSFIFVFNCIVWGVCLFCWLVLCCRH